MAGAAAKDLPTRAGLIITMPDQRAQPDRQRLIIVSLLVLVAVVVLLLPRWVTEPWIADSSDSRPSNSSITAVSPSIIAEKTQYRQNSQQVLAKIIVLRDQLNSQSVEDWAEFEFGRALALIATGDEQYGYGNYSQSLSSFEQALEQLEQIQTRGQEKYIQALATGAAAIENATPTDLGIAASSAQLAMAIEPEDSRSQDLKQRSETLPQLVAALEKGHQALADGQLQQAKSFYQQAVTIDKQHNKATLALSQVNQAITEQDFRRAMSQGFSALEDNRFAQASAAFERAGNIYPQHQAVTQALAQVETQQSQLLVSQQMQQAAEFEEQEQWQQALAIYQSLLQVDPSLTQARVRTIPVSVRATLDQQLKDSLADPLKLSNQTNYQRAQRLLADAKGIGNPGPVLVQQISDLGRALRQSITPVDVTLQSDNLTEVTLFRVAKLGLFNQTTVQLRPGRYIAAGSRMGFRDVRVEFTITGEPLAQPILVRCSEQI